MLIFLGVIVYLLKISSRKETKLLETLPVEDILRLLEDHVDFYKAIQTPERKETFKNRVIRFIQNVRFTDVDTARHTLLDEVLIASSAIIPLIAYPDWEYQNIREILLYDDHFNLDYQVNEKNHIMGMVGDGAMNDTMILSLRALREGFEKKDGSQTALHEFVHLIDKADGVADGVPEYLIPKSLIEPWLRHIRAGIIDIKQNDSDINPYAATNEQEFFAVISEYFFEKPQLLQRHHPQLYEMLNRMFKRYP